MENRRVEEEIASLKMENALLKQKVNSLSQQLKKFHLAISELTQIETSSEK